MEGSKTFVFAPEGSGSGGGLGALMGMIPSLLQGKGLDPNLVAALMNTRNNQDSWGGGCWWIWAILLFLIFGWGGNGFGGNGGRGITSLPVELNGDAGRELLMNAISGNGQAINQLASSLGCSTQQLQTAICGIQNSIDKVSGQVGMSTQQIINSIQSNFSAIGSQLASCCCDIRTSIERQGYETRLSTMEQTNTLSGKIENLNQTMNERFCQLEMREMQNKLDAERQKNTALTGQLSQEHQNNYFAQVMAQGIAPVSASIAELGARLAKIECSMPPTVAVPYPQLQAFNPECFRAAAYGAYAGDVAARYTNCGC